MSTANPAVRLVHCRATASFGQAFAAARKVGADAFEWRGARYNTELHGETKIEQLPVITASNFGLGTEAVAEKESVLDTVKRADEEPMRAPLPNRHGNMLVQEAYNEYFMVPVRHDESMMQGRRDAIRGLMVRMGLYSTFNRALAEREK